MNKHPTQSNIEFATIDYFKNKEIDAAIISCDHGEMSVEDYLERNYSNWF